MPNTSDGVAQDHGKLAELKVNLTRLLVTKGLFSNPSGSKDNNDGDGQPTAAGERIPTPPPSSSSRSSRASVGECGTSLPGDSNMVDEARRQRKAALSRLMVTKGLFDNCSETKGDKVAVATSSKAEQHDAAENRTDATPTSPQGKTLAASNVGVAKPSLDPVVQGSPKDLGDERSSLPHQPQYQNKKRPVEDIEDDPMEDKDTSTTSFKRSSVEAASTAKQSPTSDLVRSPSSRDTHDARQRSPGLPTVAPTPSLKVTSNFKIPKKLTPAADRFAGNNRREIEAKRHHRRRDILAESGSARHDRREDQEASGYGLIEPRKSPLDFREGQNMIDFTGKRKRSRGISSRNRLATRPTEIPEKDVSDSADDVGLALADSIVAPLPPPTVPQFDVVRCGNQFFASSVALVDSWLLDNPVGAKSNAAGEVQAHVKAPKVIGNAVTGVIEPSTQFGRTLAKGLEEEPMMVDTEEFVTEIHQFRKNIDCESQMICGQLTQLRSQMKEEAMSVDEDHTVVVRKKHRRIIHIVLDTNVLLSHLYMVDELMRNRPFRGTDAASPPHVVLVIPWVVLQELDGIKSNRRDTKLREMACKAVRYLHDLFTNAHPQVRGQTSREALADIGLTVECNDDKILQCCFLFKKKVVGKVILFSNDRNLCSKALVHRIAAYTKENIKRALDKIDPPANAVKTKQMPEVTEDASREKILRSYKSSLLEVLGDIVKHEMQEIYGDVWLKVVLIRPPWSNPLDVLKCLDKHWLAVFSHCVNRRAKVHMDLVFQKMKGLSAHPNHDEMKFLFIESLKLLSYFEARAAVSVRAKQGIQALRELLKELLASRKDANAGSGSTRALEPSTPSQQQQMAGPSVVVGVTEEIQQQSAAMGDDKSPAGAAIPIDPLIVVYTVFQKVWSSINHICGSIYDSFCLPNPVSYVPPPVVPAPEECFNFIPRFYPVIIELRDLLRRILRMPLNVTAREPEFSKLCHRLLNYFLMLGISSEFCISEPISPEMLHFFCTTYEKRELLSRGLIQLEECCAYIFRLILTIKDWEI